MYNDSHLELLRELNDTALQAKLHLLKSSSDVEYNKTSIALANVILDSICEQIKSDHSGTENVKNHYRTEAVEDAILNIAITCIKHLKPELLGR
jgi:hypothetical protein